MTVEECYQEMGGNYNEISGRFPNDMFITKFTLKFLNDPSFPDLVKHLKEKNVEEAFRAAHTLKGVAQNLGFSQLYPLSMEITEILRSGHLEGTEEILAKLQVQYNRTIHCIQKLSEE